MPSFEHATVAHAMHPGIVSVDPDTSVVEVARIMSTHQVHCVVIKGMAHSDPREPLVWGIITDRDLMERGLGPGAATTARDLANTPVVSVKPAMPLADARGLMLGNHVTHIVVIEPETLRPFGVLSTLDLARVLAWGEA
jgi:CBS domain-containing protein